MTPRRQAELEALVAKLARFKSTKIMVEAPRDQTSTQRDYRNYRIGKHQLTRNETEQIGFRLAHKLGHPTIYPIDFPMRMSGLRPDEWTTTGIPSRQPLPRHLRKAPLENLGS